MTVYDDKEPILIVEIAKNQALDLSARKFIKTVAKQLSIVLTTSTSVNLLFEARQYLEEKVNKRTEELTEANKNLEDLNDRISESLVYSTHILDRFIPSSEQLKEHLPESFVLWKPREKVGGDFYWCKSQGGVTTLILGDCLGHGVAGALVSVRVLTKIEQLYQSDTSLDVDEVLIALEKNLQGLWKGKRGSVNATLDLAVCRIDFHRRELKFAGAHAKLYYFLDGACLSVSGEKQALGSTNNSRPVFRKTVISGHHFEKGRFLLFTDGFFEQDGGSKGLPLGRKNFLDGVNKGEDIAVENLNDHIENIFSDYMGQNPQRDDATIIGFELGKSASYNSADKAS